MRILIKPVLDPDNAIDITERVIGVIADELGQRYGGPETLNRLGAERDLERALDVAFANHWNQSPEAVTETHFG